ncbi:MAG: hypothetical protein ACYCZ6_01525 [Polaromonas sp.]
MNRQQQIDHFLRAAQCVADVGIDHAARAHPAVAESARLMKRSEAELEAGKP